MTKRKLPDYRFKQKILYIDKTSAEMLVRYGDLYMESNMLSDALDFYLKAGHTTRLQKIKDCALQNGDTFLFQRAVKALNIEPGPADWEDIARRAIEFKKYFFARSALERTNNTELLSKLATMMKAEEVEKHP